jgi:tetratricopeptide (TPR) repeat protein
MGGTPENRPERDTGDQDLHQERTTIRRPSRKWGLVAIGASLLAVVALSGFGLLRWLSEASPDTSKHSAAGQESGVSALRKLAVGEQVEQLELPASFPGDSAELRKETEQVAVHLTKHFSTDPDAFEIAARLYRAWGNTDEAVAAWRKCLELNPKYGHAYEGLGSVAKEMGNFDDAIASFQKAVELAPTSAYALSELASCLIEQGRLDEAAKLLEEHIAKNPNNAEAYVLLGSVRYEQRDFERAKGNYETAVSKNPLHTNAHWGLKNIYQRLGLADEALRHAATFEKLRAAEREQRIDQRNRYVDVAAMGQDIGTIYVQAGRIYLGHEDSASAEAIWKRAAILHPTDVNPRQALAWFYLQRNRQFDTVRILEELSQLEPENVSYPLEIARIYLSGVRVREAEKVLKQICEKWPDEVEAVSALGELYLRSQQNPKEALELCKRAVNLDESPANLVNLAGAYEINNDLPSALKTLRRAIEKDSSNPAYQQMYATLQQRMEGASVP